MVRRSLVLALAVVAASSVPPQGIRAAVISRSAQALPQHQVRPWVLRPAPAWHAVRGGPHSLYGTIRAIKGNLIAVQLRSGRLQVVNAAAAIAHGDYSAPLFVGKFVGVDGSFVGGAFVAAHVYRLHGLYRLPNDR
jgi:hypothetical protein